MSTPERYRWDNYTRGLVRAWSQKMSAQQIHDYWPWDRKPSVSEICSVILERMDKAS